MSIGSRAAPRDSGGALPERFTAKGWGGAGFGEGAGEEEWDLVSANCWRVRGEEEAGAGGESFTRGVSVDNDGGVDWGTAEAVFRGDAFSPEGDAPLIVALG